MNNPDRLARLMRQAAYNGIIVPAFNVPYLPMLKAIASTLAEHNTFGLVEVARLEVTKFQARSLAEAAKEYRRWADPSVTSLHLDHVPVIDEDGLTVDWKSVIAEGISEGYSSVMIDGSRLPLDENIAVTSEVVSMAHSKGVLAEAELGKVAGHESGPMPPYEELFATKRGFTDPDEAKRFVTETGVDWLSVSVGSVHGAIAEAVRDQAKPEAKLDIEHLSKLRAATGIPLVLHGGSGVLQSYVDQAIKNGIAKINVGTDIRQPYERAISAGGSIEDGQAAVRNAMSHLVVDVYRIEGSAARLNSLVEAG